MPGLVSKAVELLQGKMIGRLAEISLPQPVDDCLQVMGRLLCKSKHSAPVMGSFWQPANMLGNAADASDKVGNASDTDASLALQLSYISRRSYKASFTLCIGRNVSPCV